MQERPQTRTVSSLPFAIGDVVLPVVPAVTATTVIRRSNDLRAISTASLMPTEMPFGPHFYYGTVGTPTTDHIAGVIAQWEGGRQALLTPSGQAAISAVMSTLAEPGSTVLVPDNVTLSSRWFFDRLLGRAGCRIEYYDACSLADIKARLASPVSVIFLESPGAVTFEVPDFPAIAQAAKDRGVAVVADNSWAASHYFDAIAAGADAVVVSLSKYQSGPAGVSLGAVVTADTKLDLRVRDVAALLGQYVAPDTCVKAAIAMSTLTARLAIQAQATVKVLGWLAQHPGVRSVHHPSLPATPGHQFWRRDFSGASSLCSFQLVDQSFHAACGVSDAMRLIKHGYGWGGSNSLYDVVTPYADRAVMCGDPDAAYIRLYLGLEDPRDLIDDLDHALASAPVADKLTAARF